MKKSLLLIASLAFTATVMADSASVVLREEAQSHEYVSEIEVKTVTDTFKTGRWVVMQLDPELNKTCYEVEAALVAINEIEDPHGFTVQAPDIRRTRKSIECPGG